MLHSLRFTNGPAISKLEYYMIRFELTIKTGGTLFSRVRYVLKTKKYFSLHLDLKGLWDQGEPHDTPFFIRKSRRMYEVTCTTILQDRSSRFGLRHRYH